MMESTESKTRTKLAPVFEFLKANRKYNQSIQRKFFQECVSQNSSKFENTVNVLYGVAMTQAQPKIDLLGAFFKNLYKRFDSEGISFESLCQYLSPDSKTRNFNTLYRGLKNQDGWGPKTAALFTRNIYVSHNTYATDYAFLDDVPQAFDENDKLYLPVDAVIRDAVSHIFEIKSSSKK